MLTIHTAQNETDSPIEKYGCSEKASIMVSFRYEVGRTMQAAFYDHYVLRQITGNETVSVIPPAKDKEEIEKKMEIFADYINDAKNVHTLRLSDAKPQRIMPSISTDIGDKGGLLFIPGHRRYPKPGEYYEEREKYEYQLIRDALLRGRPILAICGGAWKLWAVFGGKTIPVEGHTSPSMPTIVDDGSIGNNPQVHAIKLVNNTIVNACMNTVKTTGVLKKQPTVNSIHWAAPVTNKEVLEMMQISATSKECADNADMALTIDTIEAFENKFGVPVLGILWHPEAYYKKQYSSESDHAESKRHLNLVKCMAKSGDAYHAKQNMLKEFKDNFSPQGKCHFPSTTQKAILSRFFRTSMDSNLAFFKNAAAKYLYDHRNDGDPRIRHEYDTRFGLIPIP